MGLPLELELLGVNHVAEKLKLKDALAERLRKAINDAATAASVVLPAPAPAPEPAPEVQTLPREPARPAPAPPQRSGMRSASATTAAAAAAAQAAAATQAAAAEQAAVAAEATAAGAGAAVSVDDYDLEAELAAASMTIEVHIRPDRGVEYREIALGRAGGHASPPFFQHASPPFFSAMVTKPVDVTLGDGSGDDAKDKPDDGDAVMCDGSGGDCDDDVPPWSDGTSTSEARAFVDHLYCSTGFDNPLRQSDSPFRTELPMLDRIRVLYSWRPKRCSFDTTAVDPRQPLHTIQDWLTAFNPKWWNAPVRAMHKMYVSPSPCHRSPEV